MDPITHLASGALASQAVRKALPGKTLLVCGAVAAWIPDIDLFLTGDPEAYLRAHRGITHSFAGGVLLALAVAVLFWVFKRKQWSFSRLFAFCYGSVLLHIFLDWVNPYGTMVLMPFSNYRAMLGSVFIIDPFLTVGILLFLAIALFRRRGQRVAFTGITLVILYPFFNFVMLKTLETRLNETLAATGDGVRVNVTPDFLTPWHWKVIVEYEDRFEVAPWSPRGASNLETQATFVKPDGEFLETLARQASFLDAWIWFAGYPALESDAGEDPRTLVLVDLRFRSTHPLWQGRQPSPPPFSVEVTVDSKGDLLDWHYHEPVILRVSD